MDKSFLVFLISAVASILVGPWVIGVLTRLKVRQTISEDAPESHKTKQGTPTMGGLIILFGVIVGVLVVWRLHSQPENHFTLPILLLILAFGGLGLLDDYLIIKRGKNLGLKARQKLLGQFLLAIGFMAWVYVIRQHNQTEVFFGSTGVDFGWAYYPLAVLLIVAMSNAVNLTDGLDGLVSGLMVSVAPVTGAMASMVLGGPGLETLGMTIGGACLGFLWHNGNPAKIFMGDTGSLALGAGIAGLAIAGKCEFLFLLISLIFIFEALSVIIQVISFKTTGKRVFKMTPIHHHFELSGWPEQRIVIRFWVLQILIVAAVSAWAYSR